VRIEPRLGADDPALGLDRSDEATNPRLEYPAIVAQEIVAAPWPAVERLAGPLLGRRTLIAAAIRTIVDPSARHARDRSPQRRSADSL
jgi:hypothetical protein